MSDQSQLGLGKIIPPGKHVERDAIHIAVVPLIFQNIRRWGCYAGTKVKLRKNSQTHVMEWNSDQDAEHECIGVIDPFLEGEVANGDRVWVWLKPGSITSLRHDWTHPAFEPLPPQPQQTYDEQYKARYAAARLEGKVKEDSMTWMQQFADSIDEDLKEVLIAATEFIENGDYYSKGGKFEGISFNPDEFWPHFEVITGIPVPDTKHEHFFSCSC